MRKLAIVLSAVIIGLCSLPAYSQVPPGAVYLEGNNDAGLILCHGRGKNPTWKVVDPLRKGVNEQLGYHTLSLQLPNDKKNFQRYAEDFPEAFSRIKDGIRFLREEKGVKKIFLMGHSMGSRMASAFISKFPEQPVNGLILAGCRNNGGYPFNCKDNVRGLALPILDIWGDGESKDSSAANDRKAFQSDSYIQVPIPGANHKFEGHEDEFVTEVVNWLKAY